MSTQVHPKCCLPGIVEGWSVDLRGSASGEQARAAWSLGEIALMIDNLGRRDRNARRPEDLGSQHNGVCRTIRNVNEEFELTTGPLPSPSQGSHCTPGQA